MLHVVKRKSFRLQQPIRSAPNAEFADLKQRLSSIKASLKYTSARLSDANRQWVIQMQQQRQFSERFHESYPTTTDETYQVAVQFAEGSQALYDKFTRETQNDLTAYNDIHKQVLLYIKEIDTVEAMYPKLADAKSESSRYQLKLDSMERSKRQTDEARKARNLQKMDNERDLYKRLLLETINAQKSTYVKHPVVFKAALTSYWLSHEKHVTMLVQSLEQTQNFAKKAEKEMRDLDITKWAPPVEVEELGPVPTKVSREGVKAEVTVEEPVRVEDSDDDDQDLSFHSASTVPVDTIFRNQAEEKEPIDSPTYVVDAFSAAPLAPMKRNGAVEPIASPTNIMSASLATPLTPVKGKEKGKAVVDNVDSNVKEAALVS